MLGKKQTTIEQKAKEDLAATALVVGIFFYNFIEGCIFYKFAAIKLSTLLIISICVPAIALLILIGSIYPKNGSKQEKRRFVGIFILLFALSMLITLPGHYYGFVCSYVVESKVQDCRYRYMIFVSTEENYFAAANRISKSIKNCEKEHVNTRN